MRTVTTMTLAAAAFVGLAGGAAKAGTAYNVWNKTDHSVWVTNYNGVGHIIEASCLTSGAQKYYTGHGWDYAVGFIVYTRGEMKENSNCGGKTLSDTGRGSPISIGPNTAKVFNVLGSNLRLN